MRAAGDVDVLDPVPLLDRDAGRVKPIPLGVAYHLYFMGGASDGRSWNCNSRSRGRIVSCLALLLALAACAKNYSTCRESYKIKIPHYASEYYELLAKTEKPPGSLVKLFTSWSYSNGE
jgi:hypothetical protein